LKEQEMLKELRSKISKAREACAGSNVQPMKHVQGHLGMAIHYATKNGFKFIAQELYNIGEVLGCAQNYGDRLGPDQRLSDIINRLDRVIGKSCC